MKNTFLSLIAVFGMTSAAVAADLPTNKGLPPAPTVNNSTSGWYVGGNADLNAVNNPAFGDSQTGFGAVAGYEFNPWLRGEADFNYWFKSPNSNVGSGQALTANAIVQSPVQFYRITPYALVGVGSGWNGMGNASGNAQAIYNLGLGARYALTNRVDLDARYTQVNAWQNSNTQADQFTIGAEFKF